jgi:hypothetical protein
MNERGGEGWRGMNERGGEGGMNERGGLMSKVKLGHWDKTEMERVDEKFRSSLAIGTKEGMKRA